MGGSSLYQGGAGKGSPAEFWVKTPFIFFDNFRAPSLFLFRTIFCIVWHFLAYFFHTSYLSPMPPLYLCRWKICRVEKFQISMQDKCGDFWNFSTWKGKFKSLRMTDVGKSEFSPHMACEWCGECLHICTIYAVLSENLFCRNLRTFVQWKIEPKIASVEKKIDKY